MISPSAGERVTGNPHPGRSAGGSAPTLSVATSRVRLGPRCCPAICGKMEKKARRKKPRSVEIVGRGAGRGWPLPGAQHPGTRSSSMPHAPPLGTSPEPSEAFLAASRARLLAPALSLGLRPLPAPSTSTSPSCPPPCHQHATCVRNSSPRWPRPLHLPMLFR